MESINYHLELTPAQLKITHTALRGLLDDFGHDEHAIRAIQLDAELEPQSPDPDQDRGPGPGTAA